MKNKLEKDQHRSGANEKSRVADYRAAQDPLQCAL